MEDVATSFGTTGTARTGMSETMESGEIAGDGLFEMVWDIWDGDEWMVLVASLVSDVSIVAMGMALFPPEVCNVSHRVSDVRDEDEISGACR